LVAVGVKVIVGVEVGVGVTPATYAIAALASTMPLPQFEVVQVPLIGNDLAVFWRICSTWAGVRDELRENSKETTPLTWGAAMLVP
jgi:hypothetical protein